jgi:hypothetical protein
MAKKDVLCQTISGVNLVGLNTDKDGKIITIKGKDSKVAGYFVTFAANPNKEEQENYGSETSYFSFFLDVNTAKKLKDKGFELKSGKGDNRLFAKVKFAMGQDKDFKIRLKLIDIEKIETKKNTSSQSDAGQMEDAITEDDLPF